jgi:integration host factor subunit alpha
MGIKKNFTRKDISKKIYHNIGFSKDLSLQIVDDFFESIINELVNLKKVKIASFGTFFVNEKKERIGRNPKTKIETKINSRRVVTFKSALNLKKKINK